MSRVRRHFLFRFTTIFTLLSFFPTSVGAWNFLPTQVIGAREGGPTGRLSVPAGATACPAKTRQTPLEQQDAQRPHEPQTSTPSTPSIPSIPSITSIPSISAHSGGTTAASIPTQDGGRVRPPSRVLTAAETSALKGGQADAAAGLVAQADALRTSGRFADAGLAYLTVLDQYSDSAGAVAANAGVAVLEKQAQAGEIAPEAIADFEGRLPSWDSLTSAEAKYTLVDFAGLRAAAAQAQGDAETAGKCFANIETMAWDLLQAHPDHALQIDVAQKYMEAAKARGFDERKAAVDRLRAFIANTPPCMATWAGRFAIAPALRGELNNVGESYLECAAMLGELDQGFVSAALDSPGVYPWVKAQLEYAIGYAYSATARPSEALAHYERVVKSYPGTDEPFYLAGYGVAHATSQLYPDDPWTGIAAYYDYVRLYPESPLAAAARMKIAGAYQVAGDSSNAAQWYRQVLETAAGTVEAKRAESELGFIANHMANSVQMTAAWREVERAQRLAKAQLCGPAALLKLLASKEIPATLEELAALSGADDSGATMLGLMNAAERKGLKLVGVQAIDLTQVAAPFIAYTNGNHFVLVDHASQNAVVVSDIGKYPMPRLAVDFLREWDGKALVTSEGPALAELLNTEALKGARGGCEPPPEPLPARDTPRFVTLGGSGGAGLNGGGFIQQGGAPGAPVKGTRPPIPGRPGTPVSVTQPEPASVSGVSASGVNLTINAFHSSAALNETDLGAPIKGSLSFGFSRTYVSQMGFPRDYYTDTSKPFLDNIGKSWTHNMNVHLRVTTGYVPSHVVLVDEAGNPRYYDYSSTSGGYNHYVPDTSSEGAWTNEKGNTLKRDTTTLKYTLETPTSLVYEFSAATTDTWHFARIESMRDAGGNTVSFTYDGAVGTGKLTQVDAPSGDGRYLAFYYTSGLIVKVELRTSSTVLQQVEYGYTSGELTTVTFSTNPSVTVQYAYGTDANATGSRFLTLVTDKMANETSLAWTFTEVSQDEYEATQIDVTNEAGLVTRYERSPSSGLVAISNLDGQTLLSKVRFWPKSNLYDVYQQDYYVKTEGGTDYYDTWTYTYSGRNLTEITSPEETYATYSYTSTGQLASSAAGADADTDWTYSAGMRPASRTDTDGLDTGYTYTSAGKLSTVTHPSAPDGVTYTYDGAGQLITKTGPDAQDWSYTYDARGNTTAAADPLNNESTMVYDDFGNVTESTDPSSNTTYYEYAYTSCGSCGSPGLLTKVTDALANETSYEYDAGGRMTTETDALERETSYTYDAMNRVTRVDLPTGGYQQYTYDKLGQVTAVRDETAQTSTTSYNHAGLPAEQKDPNNATVAQYEYDGAGRMVSVTDGLDHTTTYAYDASGRLTTVTDPVSKVTRYFYDSAGRVTKVGADANGTTDPTEYYYDETTGLLETVRYYSGQNYYDANYAYDGAARLVAVTDWIDGTYGIRYSYDENGRLTRITDYDDSYLEYTYDAAGQVTAMTDYHGNTTSYTYTDAGQVETIAAPGDRTWTFGYNDLGQPVSAEWPNGMAETYAYDSGNRLSEHTLLTQPSGGTEVEEFAYTLDAAGKITRITELDGSYWDYTYDARDRLTQAYHKNSGASIVGKYEYTYDAADNLVTKVTPFLDDFNDGDYTGWSVTAGGYWSASSGYMANSVNSSGSLTFQRSRTDSDGIIRFRYANMDTSNNNYYLRVWLRVNMSNGDKVDLRFYPNKAQLLQLYGTWVTLDSDTSVTSTQGTWYDVVAKVEGSNVKVWRGETGGSMDLILETSSASVTTSARFFFSVRPGGQFRIDDAGIEDASHTSSSTLTYDNANELSTMTDNSATINFTYDAWGRMTSKYQGQTYSANYAYRYGDKLYSSVDSSFPNEGAVTYQYGGDQKRRSRVSGGVTTQYNWDSGWNLIEEEDGNGALTRTYIGGTLAQADGTNPSTGTWQYRFADHLGSIRRLHAADKATLATFQFDPYGTVYAQTGAASTPLFTGKPYDATSAMYYFPYRYYAPSAARWISKDPLGMVDGANVYAYVMAHPESETDPLGLNMAGSAIKFKITGPCMGDNCYIRNGGRDECRHIDTTITDTTLMLCIRSRCRSGKVECENNCSLSDLGYNHGIFGYRFETIHVCANSVIALGARGKGLYGEILIHEWAHSCGWNEGDGKGVPGNEYTI